MRSLVIAIIALALVLGSWGGFIGNAGRSLQDMSRLVQEQAAPQVREEQWEAARGSLTALRGQWEQKEPLYSVFMNAMTLFEIRQSLSSLEGSVEKEDAGAALAEFYVLKEQLDFLYKNEFPTIENLL